MDWASRSAADFNPLSPHGERRRCSRFRGRRANFNPLSPHGERRATTSNIDTLLDISIHSPRMGRDRLQVGIITVLEDFNPLSPHGERPPSASVPPPDTSFQSTLPAWGETRTTPTATPERSISIHSPRMGRDQSGSPSGPAQHISIHSPRMGRDTARISATFFP